jgi:CRISPR-associated protein Csx16
MSHPASKVWLVSRHPGAVEWAKQQGLHWDRALVHLGDEPLAAGDLVYGTLPVQLAARVCEAGAEYWHLQVPLGEGMRGRELSAEELSDAGARFVRYDVKTMKER